jgi:hypothetical protein
MLGERQEPRLLQKGGLEGGLEKLGFLNCLFAIGFPKHIGGEGVRYRPISPDPRVSQKAIARQAVTPYPCPARFHRKPPEPVQKGGPEGAERWTGQFGGEVSAP